MKTSTQLHDEHMHLRPHGVRPLPAHRLSPLLEACKERGIVPGIREHAPLPARYRLGPDGEYFFVMRSDEVDAFFDEFDGIDIPVGFEVDHLDGSEAETRSIVEELLDKARHRGIPIGGITGSIHFIEGRVPDLADHVDKAGIPHILCDYSESVMLAHLEDAGAELTLKRYFESLRNLIRLDYYDVVGHIDVIRKWERRGPDGRGSLFGALEELYTQELSQTLKLAAEADILVEYNTSGSDIHLGRPYLSEEGVRACVRHGVKLAISSDAHLPKHAGRYFSKALETLRLLGVDTLYAVRDRQRIAIDIR